MRRSGASLMRAILIFSLLVLTSSAGFAQSGLTGTDRTEFLENAFKVCFQKQTNDPKNKTVKVAKLAQYCVCYSDHLADRISPAENKTFDKLFANDRAELAVRLQPILDSVTSTCAAALNP
jgi:hypothetical protein